MDLKIRFTFYNLFKTCPTFFSYFIIFSLSFSNFFFLAQETADASSVSGSDSGFTNAGSYSGYNGVRPKTKINCSEDSGFSPCYNSKYENGKCDVGSFDFNPYLQPSIDYNPDYSNNACIGYLSGAGASLAGSLIAASYACPSQNGFNAGSVLTGMLSAGIGGTMGVFLSPEVALLANQYNIACVSLQFTCAALNVFGGEIACEEAGKCCLAAGIVDSTVGATISALASIYGVAKNAFENNSVCGDGWFEWSKNPNTQIYEKRKSLYARCLDSVFGNITSEEDKADGSFGVLCKNLVTSEEATSKNKHYRQYLFGGFEISDNSGLACENPLSLKLQLGYEGGKQIYYMRGPSEPQNYACERFAMGGLVDQEEVKAYECCKQAAKTKICITSQNGVNDILIGSATILGTAAAVPAMTVTAPASISALAGSGIAAGAQGNNSNVASGFNSWGENIARVDNSRTKNTFCDVNTDCFIDVVKYQIYSEDIADSSYICARSISTCPYDHYLGGGTDKKVLNSKNQNFANQKIVANFCQYMRHCTKVPAITDAIIPDFADYFISSACSDMVGDSQLSYSYAGNLLPMNNRSFSAPLVQCYKETIENSFLGNTGHSICSDPSEKPDFLTGKCKSGNILTKGEKYQESFFVKIQKNLKFLIKFILIFVVMMFGVAILMASPNQFLGKKTIISFIVKFGLVVYFAIGNAWVDDFYQALINVPGSMLNLTFHPQGEDGYLSGQDGSGGQNPMDQNDGCVFPRYDHQKKSMPDIEVGKYENRSYPPGKSYLRPWDILDCKLSRALGYGPEVSVPNIAIMIITGVFFGPLGVIFFLAGFSLFFLLLYVVIRSAQIFLLSITATTLMIYVSPLVIPMVMFEKTKSIFENWWKQIFGFVFQPMILFAYLGLLLSVIDIVFIGSARFTAGGNLELTTDTTMMRSLSVQPDVNGFKFPKLINCDKYYVKSDGSYAGEENAFVQDGWEMKDPSDDSIYCMFNVRSFEKYNGFEPFGITIPVLKSMNAQKVNTVFKLGVLMFVFCSFLEKITFFAIKLVGGSELKADWDPKIQAKTAQFMTGIQRRALGGLKKLGIGAGSMVGDAVRRNASVSPRDRSEDYTTSGSDFSAKSENDNSFAARRSSDASSTPNDFTAKDAKDNQSFAGRRNSENSDTGLGQVDLQDRIGIRHRDDQDIGDK